MYNPLSPLFPELVERLIGEGFKFFVRQSYPRGMSPGIKEAFLVTHYREIHEANAHFQSIRFDARKYVYSTDNSEEKSRLMTAAEQPDGYHIFAALLKDRSWRPPPALGPSLKAYLRKHGKSSRNISVSLNIQFGELILTISVGVETIRVPYQEVE